MSTLLEMVREASDLVSAPRPTSVVGNSDEDARLFLSLSSIEGRELSKRFAWPELTKEQTFTSAATEDQGALTAIVTDNDFDRFVPNTFWDRTEDRPLGGPLTPVEWQQLKSSSVNGPYNDFRIRGGNLIMIPAPQAGNTIAFEYVSSFWVDTDDDGAGEAATWAADTDKPMFGDYAITLGIAWRFLQRQGNDYGELFRMYETEVTNLMGRTGARRTLNLSTRRVIRPGLRVPEGNWNI